MGVAAGAVAGETVATFVWRLNNLNYLKEEVRQKIQLMDHEFELNRQANLEAPKETGVLTDIEKEDKKDDRARRQNSQQKELLRQKQKGTSKKFESSGHDVLGGGLGLDKFAPKIGT